MKTAPATLVRNFAKPLLAAALLAVPLAGMGQSSGWSLGGYAGQYYDTEPAGFTQGNASYLNQYMLAVNVTKTVWRAENWPLSLEIDGVVGQQWGQASLTEFAVVPVLRWSSFPWNHLLQTDFRAGPIGVSYTTDVGPFERGPDGRGSRWLNFLMLELAFSRPQDKSNEVFIRLHHRCAVYDLLNTYGANGEDFLVFGYRKHF